MVSKKYQSERYREARKAVLARDRVCQDCGTDENLHVHHIRPVRTFDDYEKAHDLSNLVALCQSCHPDWEGRRDRPNALDEDARVQLSQLVHKLSRETVGRLYEPPGPWILYRYFRDVLFDDRWRCNVCFRKMEETQSNADFCPHCGRGPYFYDVTDAFSLESLKLRSRLACETLNTHGIPANTDAALTATERLFERDEYHENGWLDERLLLTAVKTAVEAAYDPEQLDIDYEPICPLPRPVRM